jgi:hypothetical protein
MHPHARHAGTNLGQRLKAVLFAIFLFLFLLLLVLLVLLVAVSLVPLLALASTFASVFSFLVLVLVLASVLRSAAEEDERLDGHGWAQRPALEALNPHRALDPVLQADRQVRTTTPPHIE